MIQLAQMRQLKSGRTILIFDRGQSLCGANEEEKT
jgi:hypothetical protein